MRPELILGMSVALPLTSALFGFLWLRQSRWICFIAHGLSGTVVGAIATQVKNSGGLRMGVGGWNAPLGIIMGADGVAAFMLLVIWLVGLGVAAYAIGYFSASRRDAYFWPLWMFLTAGLNALMLSRDLFNAYVALELIGLSGVALVALPNGRQTVVAAIRYLMISLVGSLLYLSGVALTYAEYGAVDYATVASQAQGTTSTAIALAAMTTGLLMKSAIVPLHSWLPPAHASAPAPVSALLSALVVKAAFFLLVRLFVSVFPTAGLFELRGLLGVLAIVSVLWGGIQALAQYRFKQLVAYSTVSQLGYMFLLFPLLSSEGATPELWMGTFLFLMAHAFAKSSMFMVAGNILRSAGHDRISDLGEISRRLPVSMAAFGISAVSLAGLPLTGGFVGKWLLLTEAIRQAKWICVGVLIVGGLIAATYLLRVGARLLLDTEINHQTKPVPPTMEWSALGMAALAAILGLVSSAPSELILSGAPLTLEALSVVRGIP